MLLFLIRSCQYIINLIIDFHDFNLVYIFLSSVLIKRRQVLTYHSKIIYFVLNIDFGSWFSNSSCLNISNRLNVIALLSNKHPDDALEHSNTNIW